MQLLCQFYNRDKQLDYDVEKVNPVMLRGKAPMWQAKNLNNFKQDI